MTCITVHKHKEYLLNNGHFRNAWNVFYAFAKTVGWLLYNHQPEIWTQLSFLRVGNRSTRWIQKREWVSESSPSYYLHTQTSGNGCLDYSTDELRGGNMLMKNLCPFAISICSNTLIYHCFCRNIQSMPSVGPQEGFPKYIMGMVYSSNSLVYLCYLWKTSSVAHSNAQAEVNKGLRSI